MTQHNIKEFKIEYINGISEYTILKSKETFSKMLSVKVLTINSNKITNPKKILGDVYYYVLNGKGILTVEQLKGNWSWPLNSEDGVWIPPLSNFTIKNIGDVPLRMMEFCSKYDENKINPDEIKPQLLVSVVNRLQCPMESMVYLQLHTLFSARPEAKKITFVGYNTFYPKGYLPRHVPNLDCEEVQYVVSGSGTMSVGDITYDVIPGSLVYAPSHTFHDIINTSEDKPMETLICEVHP